MRDMIERMARAMHVETYATDDFDEQREEFRQEWITLAKAALTPLLDPTPEMVEAGAHKLGDGYADDDDRFWAKSVFNAMIKAIQEWE